MSDPTAPEPVAEPALEAVSAPEPALEAVPAAEPSAAAERRPRAAHAARLNPLAVAALVLGILLSPLAALFGHLAVGQIRRSEGRERGRTIAWVAVGLGYLWLTALFLVAVGLSVALGGGVLEGGLLDDLLGGLLGRVLGG
ncbi:DUF4190 domain-containing protein [Microcella frigidaquae]|uniref:DUF4190 domain-containing protein n=1 Tax=Microcella frigidaquae TaxID=424758 RepID=A0A840X5C2_9MICO|nr:DUF4190 domain-containing protein [Microcella frigidaquae]MBB5617723.1 hypothetical protein [Microcella frigidaquae]NHN45742.1 DUF4190 domain-containing protein [Microcella frigidaquae]